MGRREEFENRKILGIVLESSEKERFQEIALRDAKGDMAKLGRKVIQEYIKAHSAGNDSFKLDNWNDNPDFQAIPSLMDTNTQKWRIHLMDINPRDFFNLLKILNQRREQMISIMKERNITSRER